MIPFTRTQLIGVVNQRRPVKTPILDAHFSSGRNVPTTTVQLDIKKSPEGIATAISAGVESKRATRAGWETLTVPVPRFSEHDVALAADLKNLRVPGSADQQLPMMQHINGLMDPMLEKFDRTREFMAIRAMQGEIKDGDGTTIATYGVPAAEAKVFAADGTGDNPIDVFDNAAVSIARELGGEPGGLIAYCGVQAYQDLRNESRVQDLLKGPQGPQMLEGGEVRRVGGVQIRRLPAVFVDEQGVEQPFLADDEILIASEAMGGEEIFGPCETPEGLQMMRRFVDQWTSRDPAGQTIRVETNPLPVVRRPASIRRFTISTT